MDFKQLETFIMIVKTKSFTKAADVLYITQPSVTNHIQALEAELNTSLFVRTRRSVSLTQAGSIVYKHALNIMSTYEEIVKDLDIYSQNLKGTLNICVSSVPRKIILPNIIEKFSKTFSDISFNITNDDSRTVIDSILVGETDFGIVGLKISNPKLIYTQIMDDHIVYVVNKDLYPNLNNYSSITVDELRQDKIILREIGSGTRQIVEDELKKKNSLDVISNSVATIQDTNTILDLVAKGVGTGFISQRMLSLSKFKDEVKILNIKDLSLNRKFYFIYNKNLQFSNVNKIFKDFMLDEINELKKSLDISSL
ncbi:MAG: selenium metabolism-associated LysR family transcriptional regulator [Peptoniphilaceae bacterium]|uniref:selenium metabolism-associated LysR family transcriptional regulator n=1 Tax=Parvimonas sp. TaxID=1944660 RepID=UPI0025DA9641|nr:selenium metabolism-associated LysR family transcriptional regulator [Parvimonas sp.]MCI5996919.1 LysR family transcriptional regulator [Parvimonas sp.]MDD7765004.1 selenium metabolism-associated LysR family transcriptional regulator [Peptoniphilaceae bacterium]MDY3050312.1 selenium metabolism-associated LysR family transcriptional regulator [Parvimonas sp.]